MIEQYKVYYKQFPLSTAMELHEALKELEKLRYMFKNIHVQRVEVK